MTDGSSAASFRNNLQRLGNDDEPTDTEEEFWEGVPVFPDREKELSCIATKLTDRKKAFFDDASERERVEKTSASDEIDNSLNNRKKAFFDDASQRERVEKTSASGEIDNSLNNRKKAFFDDASQRERVEKTSASDEIDNDLESRKQAFKEDFEQRRNSNRMNDPNEEIISSLSDRKKAFFEDSSQRETFSRSQTSEGIDKSEIAFRRKSFRDKDRQSLSKINSSHRDHIGQTQHKGRRIKDANQLFKVLENRRAKLEVEDDVAVISQREHEEEVEVV